MMHVWVRRLAGGAGGQVGGCGEEMLCRSYLSSYRVNSVLGPYGTLKGNHLESTQLSLWGTRLARANLALVVKTTLSVALNKTAPS